MFPHHSLVCRMKLTSITDSEFKYVDGGFVILHLDEYEVGAKLDFDSLRYALVFSVTGIDLDYEAFFIDPIHLSKLIEIDTNCVEYTRPRE